MATADAQAAATHASLASPPNFFFKPFQVATALCTPPPDGKPNSSLISHNAWQA